MNEPVGASVQRPNKVDSYVVPLMVGTFNVADEHQLRAKSVEGTGFLVANGRGLGITARHVVNEIVAKAPIPDLWSDASSVSEARIPLAGFVDTEGYFRCAPIGAFDLHPTEDIALFRLLDDNYYSPYTVTTEPHYGAAEYCLWGYPDEVRHDYFTEEQRPLHVPLIYSAGHIRRRISDELRPNKIPGRTFYELSTPAGSCCSGAPVSVRRSPWEVVGVYVGERRNETGTFSVGFATRSEALAQHWPQLVDGTSDLAALCPLPPQQ